MRWLHRYAPAAVTHRVTVYIITVHRRYRHPPRSHNIATPSCTPVYWVRAFTISLLASLSPGLPGVPFLSFFFAFHVRVYRHISGHPPGRAFSRASGAFSRLSAGFRLFFYYVCFITSIWHRHSRRLLFLGGSRPGFLPVPASFQSPPLSFFIYYRQSSIWRGVGAGQSTGEPGRIRIPGWHCSHRHWHYRALRAYICSLLLYFIIYCAPGIIQFLFHLLLACSSD